MRKEPSAAERRLVELRAQPGEAELLAPLVLDEMLIRLLRRPGGARVAQLGLAESRVHKVAKALSWLHAYFAEPMQVAALNRTTGHWNTPALAVNSPPPAMNWPGFTTTPAEAGFQLPLGGAVV